MANADNSKRDAALDILRALACVLVVYLHSLNNVFTFSESALSKLSIPAYVFAHCSRVLGDVAVPVFIMITGYLMLKRECEKPSDIISFYKRKVLPLVYIHLIWTVIYETQNVLVKGAQFSVTVFLKRLLGLTSTSYSHLWYMPMIIGIYFAIPFVSMVVRRVPLKIMWFPLLVAWGIFDVFPSVKAFFKIALKVNLSLKIDDAVLGGRYGLLLVIGYYLQSEIIPYCRGPERRKKAVWISALLAGLSYALTVVFHAVIYNYSPDYSMTYEFPTLPLIAGSVFVFVMLVFENHDGNKLLSQAAYASFGIYICHYVFLKWFALTIRPVLEPVIGKVLLVFIIFIPSYTIAFFTVWLIGKLAPGVSGVIFLYKKKNK